MLKARNLQCNFLDDLVIRKLLPEDHELLQIKKRIDWSFVEEETKDLYREDFGRPAYPPEVMFRMLFLEFYANLSDVQVAEQVKYHLLYRVFAGLGVEEDTPDDTSLVVFRKRLGEERFQKLFDGLIAQCQSRGLIQERLKMVDATHIVADVAVQSTFNLLRQGRKVLLRAIEKTHPSAAKDLKGKYAEELAPLRKPTQEELSKEIQKSEALLQEAQGQFNQEVEDLLEYLSCILHPEKEGDKIISFIDPDARWGKKGPKQTFSGYKAHIAEDEGSELVTSVQTLAGNESEAFHLPEMLHEEASKGIGHPGVVADGMYDTADNRMAAHGHQLAAYFPARQQRHWPESFKLDLEKDCVTCPAGDPSVYKFRDQRDRGTCYSFLQARCQACPLKATCLSPKQKAKMIIVTDNYLLSLPDEGPARKAALRIRKNIERKFGQAKKWHRLARARYRGLKRVSIQVLMTFFVINAKRIVHLLGGLSPPCPLPLPAG